MSFAASRTGNAGPEPLRVFAYCHDSVGIGHLNRTLTICRKLGAAYPQANFLLATGTPYVPLFRPVPRVDYIKLPSLAKVDNQTYRGKYLTFPSARILRCRESILLETIRQLSPDFVLVDKAPLGVCRELVPALYWLAENRPETRVVFGMRDIEDAGEATIEQWTRAGVSQVLEDCFDEIWVYGMQDVFDVCENYRLSAPIRKKLAYMGYIVPDECGHPNPVARESDNVLVTVGGGTDGEALLRAYLEQSAEVVARAGLKSTIVAGPDLPAEASKALQILASRNPDVQWIDFEPCMDCRVRATRLVVTMGGYNTLGLIARSRIPTLVAPRQHPRLEQTIRARLWSERGACEVIEASRLTAANLAEDVSSMLDRAPGPTSPNLDLGGADRICRQFLNNYQVEAGDATSVCM